MKLLQRLVLLAAALLGASALGGCTTALIVAHVHAQLTEGMPTPCVRLNSVQRALSARCGEFVPGSLVAADVAAPGLPVCPLTLAAREPRSWPLLPELLARGASPEACAESPVVALAQADPCPDFTAADARTRAALRFLAEADARALHHDALRLLSCPKAHDAGLDAVIAQWSAQGLLAPGQLAFNPLSALHPAALAGPLGRALEAAGHDPRSLLGGYDGRLPSGYDVALREAHWAALDWWLARVPELADRVPPQRANQLPWVPLAQVLSPAYVSDAAKQRALIEYLLARGADPWHALPQDATRSVVAYAEQMRSPWSALLAAPRRAAPSAPATATLAGTPGLTLAH